MLLKASHIAAAVSFAPAGFNRTSDWRFVGECAHLSSCYPIDRVRQVLDMEAEITGAGSALRRQGRRADGPPIQLQRTVCLTEATSSNGF